MKRNLHLPSSRTLLVLLMLVALAIRVAAALSRQAIAGDETVYSHMAEYLAKGEGPIAMLGAPTVDFLPLLPLFTAAVSFIVQDYVVSGYVVVITFGVLLLIPTYLLGKALVSEQVGLLAAALVVVSPLMVDYSSKIYTESVYAFLLLMGAYMGWRMLHDGRLVSGALTGLSLGLAYLTNPAAVYYILALVTLGIVLVIKKDERRGARIRSMAALVMIFVLLALPYVLFLHGELGKWTYSGKNVSSNIRAAAGQMRLVTPEYEKEAMRLTEDGEETVEMREHRESPDPVTVLFTHPRESARIFAQEVRIFYREEFSKVIPWWLLPFLAVGIAGVLRNRSLFRPLAYTVLLAAPVLLIFTVDYRARFFVPFLPIALIWVAAGIFDVSSLGSMAAARLGKSRLSRESARGLALAALVIFIFAPMAYKTYGNTHRQTYATEFREEGEWIKDTIGPGRRIMNREFSAAYYAGGTVVLMPYADYERTTSYARKQGVDYMVIGRKEIKDWRPGLAALLADDDSHPDWRLVHRGREGTEKEVLVFQLD